MRIARLFVLLYLTILLSDVNGQTNATPDTIPLPPPSAVTSQPTKAPVSSNPYFPGGYIMIGFNNPTGSFAESPSPALNAEQNFQAGRMGEQQGITFQVGKVWYLNSKQERLRFGIDWTIFSVEYNKLNWGSYTDVHQGAFEIPPYLIVYSTRIGPDATFNIKKKLTVTLRAQIAPVFELPTLFYANPPVNVENGPTTENKETFTLITGSIFKNTGVSYNFGFNIRYGPFGIGFEYVMNACNFHYQYSTAPDANATFDYGPIYLQHEKSSAYQIKLIL